MTDEELGKELNRQWNAACKGKTLGAVASYHRQKLGALVRLVREALEYIDTDGMLDDPAAWLSEARALVGEEQS